MSDNSETTIIIDLLNLMRTPISDRSDAKFKDLDEFTNAIDSIVCLVKKMNNFERLYLVTKSFILDKKILYHDIPKIILWEFCKRMPEKMDNIYLVLVNGVDPQDKEADDRTLFILYNEISLIYSNILIISNDHFSNLSTHYMRRVTLRFCWMRDIGETWQKSEFFYSEKAIFQQKRNNNQTYKIMRPATNTQSVINVH
jgi:hypothetical protein